MKPKLYIHIGFPKTGSSTIQKFLNLNRKQLVKEGICYPEPLCGPLLQGHEGHMSMVEADAKSRHDVIPWYSYREKYLDALLKDNCSVNILSAEGWVYDNPENLLFFQKNFDVKFICFFRNYFDQVSSLIKQTIKEGPRLNPFSENLYGKYRVLANIEAYIDIFGRENCIFLDFDKAKRTGLLQSFFAAMSLEFKQNYFIPSSVNVTPTDAATSFFYQMSFLPLNYKEWLVLHNEILALDLSKWKDYHCSFLPQKAFCLDKSTSDAIHRQAELLSDSEWYSFTMKKKVFFSNMGDHDLPFEIQRCIFESLSDKARNIISQYWPHIDVSKGKILPSMRNIASEPFNLLVRLRQNRSVCLGDNLRLRGQLQECESSLVAIKEELHKVQQSALYLSAVSNKIAHETSQRDLSRRNLASRYCSGRTVTYCLSDWFAPIFSVTARVAFSIRRSCLFDIGWYLEQYPDVAKAGIDPVLHYVRCGAKEGRDPAPWFSTRTYLEAYPDVAASGVNPFYHYIRYGCSEGREKYTC